MRRCLVLVASLLLVLPFAAVGAGGGGGKKGSITAPNLKRPPGKPPKYKAYKNKGGNKNLCKGCQRDNLGRMLRNENAKNRIKQPAPCVTTGKSQGGCLGHDVDRRIPITPKGSEDGAIVRQAPSSEQAQGKPDADK